MITPCHFDGPWTRTELAKAVTREQIAKDHPFRYLTNAGAAGDENDAAEFGIRRGIDSEKTPRLIREPRASFEAVTKDIVQALPDTPLKERIDHSCLRGSPAAGLCLQHCGVCGNAGDPGVDTLSEDGRHYKITAKEFAKLRGLDEPKLSRSANGCVVVAHMHLGGRARLAQKPRLGRKAYFQHYLAKSLERSSGVVYRALRLNEAMVTRAQRRREEVHQTVKEWEQQRVTEHQLRPDKRSAAEAPPIPLRAEGAMSLGTVKDEQPLSSKQLVEITEDDGNEDSIGQPPSKS
ncbi:hypothetical protein RI367_008780 [Sorochytrium milnesiophthora]